MIVVWLEKINNPPYKPTCNFYLFSNRKADLRRRYFADEMLLQTTINEYFKNKSKR